MSKYAYNYKPTQEEINNAWGILSLTGKTEITFELGFYGQSEDEQLDKISSLIRSMNSFNNKCNVTIAGQFKDFFKSLPRVQYGEGNPNNGNALFDKIILRGDDTIIFRANGFNKNFEQYDWVDITRWIEKVGEEFWKADESRLLYRDCGGGFSEYTIRFWWD